jgi:geranylgeranyl diphosphate synthase type II
MDSDSQFDPILREMLDAHLDTRTPGSLVAAIEHAVFPGGHRIRPRITIAVARACGIDDPDVALAAAASLEFLHCASLVHDDMPCFDDAATRRGKPSVHAAFGEALALLAGDALIVLSFQVLVRGVADRPDRFRALTDILGRSAGLPGGIVAGQGWECEADVDLDQYHRAKTGALFGAATMAGAAAAGFEHAGWARMGERLGRAYQVADDLLDRFGDPEVIGKPVGCDQKRGRPNCVSELGVEEVSRQLKTLVSGVQQAIPACPGRAALAADVQREAQSFVALALGRRRAA